jgi:hypothetical protein
MKRLALSTILLVASSLLASGCVYKMNIQQGNYLVAESVSQLKEGMTRSQVRFLLGHAHGAGRLRQVHVGTITTFSAPSSTSSRSSAA